ncbi:MAG: Rrf2 family transcriptional regulator [Verrucomicrobia bacterium]|nr:Rrf2 family transcriptional regulator [Verrucomicrobiota bacterium]MCF7709069.1 Rrf2 family transcriptional regulator [Verrucomicrobiota bacterium]
MKLSVKSDYAIRAVFGLAVSFHAGKPRRVDDIADEFNIPPNYLVQILIELKSKRIVRSHRGRVGGYSLACPPSEITLGDILRCIHGAVYDTPALNDPNCPRIIKNAWTRIKEAAENTADDIDFQKLLDQSSKVGNIYYI